MNSHSKRVLCGAFTVLFTLPVFGKEMGMPILSSETAQTLDRLEFRNRAQGISVGSWASKKVISPPDVDTIRSATFFQRNYEKPWVEASSYERALMAEGIGEQARARYAAERGWYKRLGSQNRGIVQGPDSLYWDPYTGRFKVFESKGGTSQIKMTYEAMQGTNRNAIRSAYRALNSPKTGPVEKVALAETLVAAKRGILETGVLRGTHNNGRPGNPVFEGVANTGEWDVRGIPKEASRKLEALRETHPKVVAQAERNVTKLQAKFVLGKGLAVLGFLGSGAIAWDSIQDGQKAWGMFRDPALGSTALPYLQAGLSVGKAGEAVSLSLASGASLGFVGKATGKLSGKAFLPLAIAVEVGSEGIAFYEYSTGRISQRDFYRRSTGPAIFGVCVTGGAVVGGVIGAPAGGVGAIPGAGAGAGIGAVIAVPLQVASDFAWDWYYKKDNLKLQQAVDEHVMEYYFSKPQ